MAAISGREAGHRLARSGALALAVDAATILLSQKLCEMSETKRLAIIGHELAHTIQLARGGSDASELLESEAWRASWAALRGERFAVRGRARQDVALPAVALVMDNNGAEYFKVFDTLASLQVTKVELIKPLTYEKLLDLFLDQKFASEKDFVIQAHGINSGFFMPIVTGQAKKKSALAHILRQLMLLGTLLAAYKAAGDDLDKLKAVMKDVMRVDPASDAASAKSTIEREIGRQKGLVGIDKDEDIERVVKKMADVRQKQRGAIELRTCSMGASKDTLTFFREQFNANSLAAPDVLSAFGSCRPDIGAKAMETFVKNHAAKGAFTKVGKDQFGFTYDDITETFVVNTFSAAVNEGVVKTFVTDSIMGGKKFKAKDFPVHFLVTRPALFPLNPGYQSRIVRVKRP